jgi:hypothetical protein
MEVHRINSYGKDPFISIGNSIRLKYSLNKSQSIETYFLKLKTPNSTTSGGLI